MILKLKYPVLLLILSVIFYSCEKEFSIEGNVPASTSVFSFVGAPGNCASAVVTGNYITGTALDATAIATIAVDVTTIGSYNITTPAANGISFAGTGSFTTTGLQAIELTGTGIPVSTGTFPFTPDNGCAFPVTFTSAGSNTAVFTYDGGTGTCAFAEQLGFYVAGTALAGSTVSIDVTVSTVGSWSVSTALVNGIIFTGSGNFISTGLQKLTLTGAGTPTAAGVFNFTPTGGCSFPVTVLPAVTDFITCTIDGVATTFNVSPNVDKVAADSVDISGSGGATANSPFFGFRLTKSPAITTGNYDRLSATNLSIFCLVGYEDGVSTGQWSIGISPATTGFTVVVTALGNGRIEGTFSGTLYSDPVLGTGPKMFTGGTFSLPY